jgi:hypothetical protein
MSVDKVDGPAVRDVLVKIWLEKPETARRVRQIIVAVIDWAVGRGYREMSVPMAVANRSLPKAKARAKHHAALTYPDLPKFMTDLRAKDTIGRLALEFAILTAARSGEVPIPQLNKSDQQHGHHNDGQYQGSPEHIPDAHPCFASAHIFFVNDHHRAQKITATTMTSRIKPPRLIPTVRPILFLL